MDGWMDGWIGMKIAPVLQEICAEIGTTELNADFILDSKYMIVIRAIRTNGARLIKVWE